MEEEVLRARVQTAKKRLRVGLFFGFLVCLGAIGAYAVQDLRTPGASIGIFYVGAGVMAAFCLYAMWALPRRGDHFWISVVEIDPLDARRRRFGTTLAILALAIMAIG